MVKEHDESNTVCFGIGSYHSAGMMSSNPHSGIYEATTSRTLDAAGGNPACNQGGIMIVEPSTVDFGRTADRIYLDAEKSTTLSAQDGGMGAKTGLYLFEENRMDGANYIVRRLTPLECERLQGFPDGWTEGVSDTARYRCLGNSVAVPCVEYIMQGIAEVMNREE